MKDLVPLFTLSDKDGRVHRVIPRVTDGEKTFKSGKMISNLAEAIEERAKLVAQGDDTGLLTLSAYILLETLLRLGQGQQVAILQASPATLQQAAYYCTIGLLAGREIPEGIHIETAEADGDTDLREKPKGTTGDEDEPSDNRSD